MEVFENVFGQLFQTERLKQLRVTDDYGFTQVHDSLLRYLRRCVSGEDHPFALPEIPCYLNEVLACEDFYGGIEPRIGRKHMRVIAIDGFPKMSSPGILRELDNLPIEYRWNTRAILIDAEEARGHARHAPEEVALEDPRMEGSNLQNAIWRNRSPRAANGNRMPKRPWALRPPVMSSSHSTRPT